LTRLFLETIRRPELTGTFNAVAPNPVTNNELMRQLRHAFRRPWSPPAPGWAIKIGARLMGTDASLALDGCRVLPRRFTEARVEFQFPELDAALRDIF
jgi:NAD dependent epimerase/dehydratase family enzyme